MTKCGHKAGWSRQAGGHHAVRGRLGWSRRFNGRNQAWLLELIPLSRQVLRRLGQRASSPNWWKRLRGVIPFAMCREPLAYRDQASQDAMCRHPSSARASFLAAGPVRWQRAPPSEAPHSQRGLSWGPSCVGVMLRGCHLESLRFLSELVFWK